MGGLVIKTDGPRTCLKCAAARVPEQLWGSWTWAFGDCACGHFGLTTLTAEVDITANAHGLGAQGELFIDK